MKPAWARPPSTASSDGSKPVSTTPKPGQWNPDYKPSSTVMKPRPTAVVTHRPVTPPQTSTSTPLPSPPFGHPEDEPQSLPVNEIDETEKKCSGDFMPHVQCDKVRHNIYSI